MNKITKSIIYFKKKKFGYYVLPVSVSYHYVSCQYDKPVTIDYLTYLFNLTYLIIVDSRFFEPVLVRICRLFEEFFIPRGFSLTNSCKYLSVIRTCNYSKFVYLKIFFIPLDEKTVSSSKFFQKF